MSVIDTVIRDALVPALALLPPRMDTPAARVILLAIGLQESRLVHQVQIGGPAHGLWQFERAGGVRGVLTHPASRDYAYAVCAARGVQPVAKAVYDALAGTDDVLDAALARLLLWTDPWRLPALGDVEGAWALYARVWRPGRPHPETWPALYAQALAAVTGD